MMIIFAVLLLPLHLNLTVWRAYIAFIAYENIHLNAVSTPLIGGTMQFKP